VVAMADEFSVLDDIVSDVFADEFIDQKDRQRVESAKNTKLVSDYRALFATEQGQRVLWDILSQCHIFHTTFTGNSRGMFLEGERNIGLYLLYMAKLAEVKGE
jgi:hypothetical protein